MNKIITLIIILIIVLAVFFAWWQLGREQEEYVAGDSSLTDIKERGKLIVGTFPKITPMTYHDEQGNNVGHDIDVIKEVASQLGVSIEFKEIFFPDMLEAVKKGEVDVAISAITITTERSKEMLFSAPYFDAGQTIIAQKNNENIKSPQDLRDKKVGVPRGTTCEKTAKEYVDPENLESYDDFEEVELLVNGKLDAIVHDYVAAVDFVKKYPTLKIVGEPFTQEYYGIASHKDNKALIDKIDKILREMKRDGQLKEIWNKWIGG